MVEKHRASGQGMLDKYAEEYDEETKPLVPSHLIADLIHALGSEGFEAALADARAQVDYDLASAAR